MVATSAERAQAETSLLARRLFSSPAPRRLIAPIAGVSLLTTIFLAVPEATWESLARTFLVVAGTLYGSAALTYAVIRATGGRTFLRRTTLQAFADGATVLGFAAFVGLAQLVTWASQGAPFAYDRPRVLILGFAATAWLRHAVWIATSDHRHRRTVLATAVTPFLGFLAVKVAYDTPPADDFLFPILFSVFLLAGIAFTIAANQPIRQAFGADGLRLMRQLLDHMTDQTEESQRELESFFDSFATPAEVRVGALAFRAAHGPVALVVASHAHPGPFGRVAGSDMPAKVRSSLEDVCKAVLVPHGPSTHDSNPSTTAECAKIGATVRDLLQTAIAMPGGSHFARAVVGTATVTAQLFGDVALVTASLAPNPTDDIDVPTGMAAIRAAKDAGARDCLFVDAHNSSDPWRGMVRFGSEDSGHVIEATHKAVLLSRERLAASVRVGFAERSFAKAREGIGAQGLQVLAVEADGRRVAYLLFDGNNMVPGVRDEILLAVRGVVSDAEVLTTDNHSVNARMGGYNPIGLHMDRERIVAVAKDVVRAAFEDLRPVESLAASGTLHGLRVFGHENTVRLTTSVNATISILRVTALLTFGFALAVSLTLLVALR
jgi:putative membrane protein